MKRWMIRPVARCKNGCIGARVAPAFIKIHNIALETKLAVLICLNLFDAIFTLCWVILDLAEELNPFMDYLLSSSPLAFMVGKIILVHFSSFLLWIGRYSNLSHLMASFALLCYGSVCLFHLGSGIGIVI